MWKYVAQALPPDDPDALRGGGRSSSSSCASCPGDVVELRFAGESGVRLEGAARRWSGRASASTSRCGSSSSTWMWGLARLDFGTLDVDGRADRRGDQAPLRAVARSWPSWPPSSPCCSRSRSASLAALKQDTWVDYAVRIFSIAGIAMPSFWLGILMILGLLIVFQWLPPMVYTPFWVNPWQNLAQLIWPALAVGYRLLGGGDAHDPLGDARGAARGLHPHRARQGALVETLILTRHALKNAMLPGADGDRHRVRLPHGRARRDRAGLQPQRPRPAVRPGGRAPRLHADPGPRAAGGGDLHRRELRDGPACTPGSTRGSGTGRPWRSRPRSTSRPTPPAAEPAAGLAGRVVLGLRRRRPLGAIGRGRRAR